jgi:hypothetical protein
MGFRLLRNFYYPHVVQALQFRQRPTTTDYVDGIKSEKGDWTICPTAITTMRSSAIVIIRLIDRGPSGFISVWKPSVRHVRFGTAAYPSGCVAYFAMKTS